jgi:hypothetical protein
MNRAITVTVACLVGAGCTGEDAKGELPMLGQMGDPVRWSEADDPSLIDDDLLRDINQLPLRGQVDPPPWPGSFWPAASDSIAYRWAGPTSESPAAKYQRAFGGERIEERVSQSFAFSLMPALVSASVILPVTVAEARSVRAETASGSGAASRVGMASVMRGPPPPRSSPNHEAP